MKSIVVAAVVGIAIGSVILYKLVGPKKIFKIDYTDKKHMVWRSWYAETEKEARAMVKVLKSRGFLEIDVTEVQTTNADALIRKTRKRMV